MPGFHNHYTCMPGVNSYSMPGLANCDTGHKALCPVSEEAYRRLKQGESRENLLQPNDPMLARQWGVNGVTTTVVPHDQQRRLTDRERAQHMLVQLAEKNGEPDSRDQCVCVSCVCVSRPLTVGLSGMQTLRDAAEVEEGIRSRLEARVRKALEIDAGVGKFIFSMVSLTEYK